MELSTRSYIPLMMNQWIQWLILVEEIVVITSSTHEIHPLLNNSSLQCQHMKELKRYMVVEWYQEIGMQSVSQILHSVLALAPLMHAHQTHNGFT